MSSYADAHTRIYIFLFLLPESMLFANIAPLGRLRSDIIVVVVVVDRSISICFDNRLLGSCRIFSLSLSL